MRKLALDDEILLTIEKPARYIGNEVNAVMKDKSEVAVRFAMCFPDVYEIGMSHLGIQILYDMFNQRDDIWCERVYSPWPDMDKVMRDKKIPLFALESQDPVKDFDFLGITIQYEMCYTNILQILDLSGIPLLAEKRTWDDPIVIGGGPCTYNPEPLAQFFDIFYIGEGETVYFQLMDLYKEERAKGSSRMEFLKKAAEEQIDVRCLEYGSGTAVPYFRDKTAETFEEAGLKGLQDAVKGMQWKGHVTVELGRALAAMCGYYLTKVEDTKTSDGIHYCIVDGGCHQLNYDGQIKGMYEPYVKVLPKEVSVKVAEVSENKNIEEKTWKVCGSLCTLNDVLCNEITLKGLEKGTILVFERTGAYSAMEGMALFLSHELPGVVLYSEEEGWIQARVQQETYELNMVEQLQIQNDRKRGRKNGRIIRDFK